MTGCCCCFPPSAKVLTTSGYVRIADLKQWHTLLTNLEDKVWEARKALGRGPAASMAPTAFYTYLHYDPKKSAEFLVLACENGMELVISERHLLFKVDANAKTRPIQAKQVGIGDKLVYVDGDAVSYPVVMGIGTRIVHGVYAPLTGKGTLIVDGFVVSCYAEVGSHAMAHAATAPLRAWYRKWGRKGAQEVEGVHSYAKVLAAVRGIKL